MRAYHRIDPLMDERKSHYTPAQFGAFLKVQLVAGRQSSPGRFRSVKGLVGSLPGAYARMVPFLLEQGDLVTKPDGSVYVDGWDEWQEGDLTVKDRMARLRNRRRNSGVTGGVTPPVTQPSPTANAKSSSTSLGSSSSSPSVGVGSGVSAESARASVEGDTIHDVVHRLTAVYLAPSSRNGDRVTRWVEKLGRERVERELRETADDLGGLPETNQLLNSAEDRLFPSIAAPSPKESAARVEADAERARQARSFEATRRRQAEFDEPPAVDPEVAAEALRKAREAIGAPS